MALKGNLTDMNVSDLIQVQCNTGERAALVVRRDGREGTIYFDAGEVIHAVCSDLEGEAAVYELLTWGEGTFEVVPGVRPALATITGPWSALIMEGLRRYDERRAAQASRSRVDTRKERGLMAAETRRQRLARTLRELIDTSGDVNGVAIVSLDGLIMAADLPASVEQARVGAVAAAILNLSGRSVKQLSHGDLQQTTIQGTSGYIILTQAGPNAVLVALTGQGVNLGMVFLEVRECAAKVAEILS